MFKYIDVIIDDPNSWMWQYVKNIEKILEKFTKNIRIFENSKDIKQGDILFILSCVKILTKQDLQKHKNNIVIHGSDLPKNKGWSPISYHVESGLNLIPITLFEAAIELDSGNWYIKDEIKLVGDELIDEIRMKQVLKTLEMIKMYLKQYPMKENKQTGEESFNKKRTSKNQEIDINKSIKEQFNNLRVCDNERYPAHFFIDKGGGSDIKQKFIIKIYAQ